MSNFVVVKKTNQKYSVLRLRGISITKGTVIVQYFNDKPAADAYVSQKRNPNNYRVMTADAARGIL